MAITLHYALPGQKPLKPTRSGRRQLILNLSTSAMVVLVADTNGFWGIREWAILINVLRLIVANTNIIRRCYLQHWQMLLINLIRQHFQ